VIGVAPAGENRGQVAATSPTLTKYRRIPTLVEGVQQEINIIFWLCRLRSLAISHGNRNLGLIALSLF
jgi:hypothetical protein